MALDDANTLEAYISFLPYQGQEIIAEIRQDAQEPVSIFTTIHWVCHHPDVDPKLAIPIIKEVNAIMKRLKASPHSTFPVHSLAALTLTPDICYVECFNEWQDYNYIRSTIPYLELMLHRPMYIRPNPHSNKALPQLWKRLKVDSKARKAGNKDDRNK